MSPPKVSYISPAAQAFGFARQRQALEQTAQALRAELEFTLEHIERLKGLTADLEAKYGLRPEGRGATNVKEPALSKRSSRT